MTPLPAASAVGLDDDRRIFAVFEDKSWLTAHRERRGIGRRHIGMAQQVLAEDLARFQLGRGLRRAEGSQARLLKRVDQAGRQRGFGADDREVDLVLLGELEQPLTSVAGMSTFSASSAVPALPGATNTRSARCSGRSSTPGVFATTIAND